MDPITLIVTALTAGAAAAAKDTAGQAVKEGYEYLKAFVKHKFTGNPDAEAALEKHELKPDVYKEPLKDELKQAGADKDEELIKLAQSLMKLVDPHSAQGKYDIHISGNVQGLAQGDNQNVTMNFGDKPTG